MNDWRERIDAAADRTAGLLRRTPLMETHALWNERLVEVKLEQMQHTGTFKPRGAFNAILSQDVPPAGVVAASGGNHGAAVAYAATKLGLSSKIFVPEMAGISKIRLIEKWGADLVVVPGAYANAMEEARAWEEQSGALQIHAYDSPATVEGQGTVFREWEAQGLDADTVLVAVGGGGLIAGAMAWFGEERKVVAVESEGCATFYTAMREGVDAEINVSGIAADSLGARKIGKICHELGVEQLVETVIVNDAAILEAQRHLWDKLRLLVEPASAVGLAALRSGVYQPEPGERVALLLCGANVSPDPIG